MRGAIARWRGAVLFLFFTMLGGLWAVLVGTLASMI